MRSMTQSRGEYRHRFERYEEAPMDVQKRIIEARAAENKYFTYFCKMLLWQQIFLR